MPWLPVPLPTGIESARSKAASDASLENLYAEPNPNNSVSPFTLYGDPGLLLWSTIGLGFIRGSIQLGADVYFVSGTRLFAVAPLSKVATDLGEIAGVGAVRMITNRTHVGIATSGPAYAANRIDGVIELPEGNFNGATAQDGIGIFTRAGTNQFFITPVDDMTTINATDFTSADTFEDNLVGCLSDHRQLHMLKTKTIEIFDNAGLATFPFVRSPTGFIEQGVISGDSAAKDAGSIYLLGSDLYVYKIDGYSPQKISTPWVDRLISQTNDQKSAKGFIYRQDGHTHYKLVFSDLTLAYDITNKLWRKRSTRNVAGWRGDNYLFVEDLNLHLVGDFENGNVYELDPDTFTDNGVITKRVMTFPQIQAKTEPVSMHGFRLDMEAGVGLTTGQGSNPKAILEWSDDGGQTYVGGRPAVIGRIGEYKRRVQWNRLGRFRRRIMRVTITEPVKIAVFAAHANLEGGIGGAT